MKAEEAMGTATADLIKADAPNGLVTIYRSRSGSGWDYHVRFLPREGDGSLHMEGNLLAGSATELQDAVSIARERFSVKDEGWIPQDQVHLVENSHGALQLEGRDIDD